MFWISHGIPIWKWCMLAAVWRCQKCHQFHFCTILHPVPPGPPSRIPAAGRHSLLRTWSRGYRPQATTLVDASTLNGNCPCFMYKYSSYWCFFGINPRGIDVLMGTFTKSFGAIGGYIAGNKTLIDCLHMYGHASPYTKTIATLPSSPRLL